jgi:tetratricopeptide (TPR) repeat protein
MPKKTEFSDLIWELFQKKDWDEARRLLEAERKKTPDDHWVLTQLAETFYEQKRYENALHLLIPSLKLVHDCPLTLWHLGGTLDALGDHRRGLAAFTNILTSKKTPGDDPCWESEQWTDMLKTDCLYRIGICFEHLGRVAQAEQCYISYLKVFGKDGNGSYSADEVLQRLQKVNANLPRSPVKTEIDKLIPLTNEETKPIRTSSSVSGRFPVAVFSGTTDTYRIGETGRGKVLKGRRVAAPRSRNE